MRATVGVRRRLGGSVLVAGAALFSAGAVGAGPAAAAAAPTSGGVALASTSCAVLPASFGYTEFSPGAVNEVHGDSDGPTAFGGVSTLGNFGISEDTSLLPPSDVGFVAGGAVTGGNTTAVHEGNAYADAAVTGVSVQTGTLTQVSPANLPVNFASTAAADSTLSSELAALPTSSGDLFASSGATLTLSATVTEPDNQYVWDLTPSQLASITTISVAGVPAGGSVVVNVPVVQTLGVSTIILDGVTSSGTAGPASSLADSTIFNFANTGALTLLGTWQGTLFAPNAQLTFSSGHVWGTVVGATLTGTNESTYGPLDTNLCVDLPGPAPQLPEGQPLLLILGAATLLGGGALILGRPTLRRRALADNR